MHAIRTGDHSWICITHAAANTFSVDQLINEVRFNDKPIGQFTSLAECAEYVEAVIDWVSTTTHGVKTPTKIYQDFLIVSQTESYTRAKQILKSKGAPPSAYRGLDDMSPEDALAHADDFESEPENNVAENGSGE